MGIGRRRDDATVVSSVVHRLDDAGFRFVRRVCSARIRVRVLSSSLSLSLSWLSRSGPTSSSPPVRPTARSPRLLLLPHTPPRLPRRARRSGPGPRQVSRVERSLLKTVSQQQSTKISDEIWIFFLFVFHACLPSILLAPVLSASPISDYRMCPACRVCQLRYLAHYFPKGAPLPFLSLSPYSGALLCAGAGSANMERARGTASSPTHYLRYTSTIRPTLRVHFACTVVIYYILSTIPITRYAGEFKPSGSRSPVIWRQMVGVDVLVVGYLGPVAPGGREGGKEEWMEANARLLLQP